MKFNFLFKTLLFVFVTVLFASCDKDFNEIGSDVIGDDHYNFDTYTGGSVVAYNQKLGAVQTNNLLINSLGFYNNPVFGSTKASFVTQLELGTASPKFYNPTTLVIDSVYLYVPYFSTFKSKDSETGDSTYEPLDSVQGSSNFKLSVYENGYFLRDYQASSGLQEIQKYYSDQTSDFDAAIANGGNILNDDALTPSQNSEFRFSNEEIKITYLKDGEQKVKERLAPGMFLNLNKTFFKNKIVNAPTGQLVNNNVFKNYFRGLYFKADASATSPTNGSMARLNFNQGKITIIYHDETSATDATSVRRTITLNLAGNTVNLFENQDAANYSNTVSSANSTLGDSRLYVKGQQGAITVIDILSENEIAAIKADGWLINEANLTFYIDQDAMADPSAAPEPNRLYLYDLNNRRPIVDYYTDNTTSNTNVKFNKFIHGGIIENETVAPKRGIQYKIRLTNHIKNLINKDSTNVKLGLAVTESIGIVTTARLRNPITLNDSDVTIDRVPVSSVLNPLGTILYGSKMGTDVPEPKRMKLEIFYTKPE